MSGWVKLHRKMLNSEVWKNHNVARFWMWCLMKASHKDTTAIVGYQTIHLKAGQFVTGRKKASVETSLSERQRLHFRPTNDQQLDHQNGQQIFTSNYSKLGYLPVKRTRRMSNKKAINRAINRANKRPTNDQQTTNKRPHTRS